MSGYQDFFKARNNVVKSKKVSHKSPPKNNTKNEKSSSVWLALLASVLAGGSIWYLTVGERQTAKIISRVEVSVMGSAQAEEGAKTAEPLPRAEEKKSPEVKETKHAWTDEEVALFTKLEDRKHQLDDREASLNKLEEELQKQKEDLEKRLAALEDVRGKISAKLEDKVKADGEKVAALVSVFANMKPGQAAQIIQGLNEDLAVEVLTKMKNKSAAEILNLMDTEKAKHLSERFAGFRSVASQSGQ